MTKLNFSKYVSETFYDTLLHRAVYDNDLEEIDRLSLSDEFDVVKTFSYIKHKI